MKKQNKARLLFLISFSLLLSFNLVSALWSPNLNEGLEAGYIFQDSNLVDVLGMNNGTNNGFIFDAGLINNSAYTSGSPNDILFPAFHSTKQNISYSYWINWSMGGDDIVERLWSSHSEFDGYIREADGKLTLILKNEETMTTNNAVHVDEWTHIVFTCNIDDKNQSIYINGVLDSSAVNSLGCPVMVGGLYFGRHHSSGARFYKGWIDEAYFWNKVINKTEVTQLYQNGLSGISYSPTLINDVTINSVSPINNTKTNGNTINFTANIVCNNNCKNATLYFQNSTTTIYSVSSTLTGIGTIQLGNEVNISAYGGDGYYLWYYDIFDTLNNTNSSQQRTIAIDLHSPFIIWNNPSAFVSTYNNNYTLNISISNFLLEEANVTIFNSSGSLIYNNLTTNINSPTFQIGDLIPLDLGNNTIGIYAKDNATNTAYKTKIIQRNIVIPFIPPTNFPNEIQSSGVIYETLRSVGAGVYFLLFGTSKGIGIFLTAIIIISIFAVIGYSIAKAIPNMIKTWQMQNER